MVPNAVIRIGENQKLLAVLRKLHLKVALVLASGVHALHNPKLLGVAVRI